MHKSQNLIALAAKKAAHLFRLVAVIHRQIFTGLAVLIFGCLNSAANGAEAVLRFENSLVAFEGDAVLLFQPEITDLSLSLRVVSPGQRSVFLSPPIRLNFVLIHLIPTYGPLDHHSGMFFVTRLLLSEHLFSVCPVIGFYPSDLLGWISSVDDLVFGEHRIMIRDP